MCNLVTFPLITDESGLPFHARKTYLIHGSTAEGVQIVWDEYDFKMEIPRDALSDVGDGEFNITISVIKSGHVQFPSRTKPVSAVYGIQTISFSEPVTVELEHCCEINTFTSGSLVFGVVNELSCAPYKFEKLEGGIFPEGRHGRITTAIAGLSLFVILLKQQENTEMPVTGYLAYFLYEHQKSITRKVWEIDIAVVQNNKASKEVGHVNIPHTYWYSLMCGIMLLHYDRLYQRNISPQFGKWMAE